MQSHDRFVGSAVGTLDTAALPDSAVGIAVQVASVTTQQMRDGARTAKLTVQYLRRNVSVVSGSGGNVLVLAGPDGKLVVDSGFATSKLQMSKAFDSISKEPLRFLINTHWHFDHTDGNEWMHAAGATILAQEKTLLRMQHKQSIPEFAGVYPPSPPAALPTVTFDRTKDLELNGQKLFLARYTPAHTETDISVFLPDADVLHTGDTWFSGFYPFIDYNSGGSIDGMIAACRETLERIGPSTILVCGHGAVGGGDGLLEFEQMLVDIRSRVADLKRAGVSVQETIARKPTASFDERWGGGFISPDLFTWLVYKGV